MEKNGGGLRMVEGEDEDVKKVHKLLFIFTRI